jgi:hypothetical protein
MHSGSDIGHSIEIDLHPALMSSKNETMDFSQDLASGHSVEDEKSGFPGIALTLSI